MGLTRIQRLRREATADDLFLGLAKQGLIREHARACAKSAAGYKRARKGKARDARFQSMMHFLGQEDRAWQLLVRWMDGHTYDSCVSPKTPRPFWPRNIDGLIARRRLARLMTQKVLLVHSHASESKLTPALLASMSPQEVEAHRKSQNNLLASVDNRAEAWLLGKE